MKAEQALREASALFSGVYHAGGKTYGWNEYDPGTQSWMRVSPIAWPHARPERADRIAQRAYQIMTGYNPAWCLAFHGPAVKRLRNMLKHIK